MWFMWTLCFISTVIINVSEESKILSNSHHSLNSIRGVTSAFVQIGGLHITEDKGKLPPKLKSWLDTSTKGIVYFDLGGEILVENLPRKVIIAFLASFAKLKPVRILMKVKDIEKLPVELPRNIKACAHIPRIQVLAHKNVKAIITPGENLTLQEALYFGVPIIGISFSPVHSQNLLNLVDKFVAFQINFQDLNEQRISEALTIVLNVKIFSKQAKYIIRNGPKSLKSPTTSLNWYQNELILFSLLSFIYLMVLIIKKIIKSKFYHINKKESQENKFL